MHHPVSARRPLRDLLLSISALVAACHASAGENGNAPASSPTVVKRVSNAVERGASAAGRGIETGVNAAASGVKRAASAAERGARKVGSVIERGAARIGLPASGASAPASND